MPFDHSGTVGKGESGGDGVEVLTQEAGEGPDRRLAASFGLPDPLGEEVASTVSAKSVKARARLHASVMSGQASRTRSSSAV